MSAPFRPVFMSDLPSSWQTTPDAEQLRARAIELGISPENMTRRIVFYVPEHPIFFQYERFLHSLDQSLQQNILNCVIQNADVGAQQSKPGARKRLMKAMDDNGAPNFECLACAEYQTPLQSRTVEATAPTSE